ncbi:MAG: hypothetical protein V1770_01355 [bacterium]
MGIETKGYNPDEEKTQENVGNDFMKIVEQKIDAKIEEIDEEINESDDECDISWHKERKETCEKIKNLFKDMDLSWMKDEHKDLLLPTLKESIFEPNYIPENANSGSWTIRKELVDFISLLSNLKNLTK